MAKKEEVENMINQLAIEYYNARKVSNKAQETKLWSELYKILAVPESPNPVNRILNKKIKYFKADQSKLHDFVTDNILKYDCEKNDNFCSFLYSAFDYNLKDYKKKEKVTRTNKKTGEKTSTLRNATQYNEEGYPDITITDKDADPQQSLEEKEIVTAMKIKLPSIIMMFYKHHKGKSANKQKLSYFKIFFTESLINLIRELNSIKDLNKAEAYDASDEDFVSYISDSEYKGIEDILSFHFKNVSEITGCSDVTDKKISVPCENKIIVSYRYDIGLDKEKVSEPAVSQQRASYKKDLNMILSNEKEEVLC